MSDDEEEPIVETVLLKVNNVKCQGCASAITAGLQNRSGVAEVSVDVAAGEVTVKGEGLDVSTLGEALTALGYPPAT